MPLKTQAGIDSDELGTIPPPDYIGPAWIEDAADVFHVPSEVRAVYCRPDAPPVAAQMRKLWSGGVRLNRVVREGKRYVWAPAIVNSGNLKALRPTSPDEIVVDPSDPLHTAAWKHLLRVDWAERQLRAAEDSRRRDAAQPRCRICESVLFGSSPPHYSPWTKGTGRLCSPCSAAIDLAGAERHRSQYRDRIEAFLQETAG